VADLNREKETLLESTRQDLDVLQAMLNQARIGRGCVWCTILVERAIVCFLWRV